MSREKINDIKPFLSLMIVFVSLLVAVFLKMEVRRMGYQVLKLSNDVGEARDENRTKRMKLAKLIRPSRIQKIAEARLMLRRGDSSQFIHVASINTPKWKKD